MTDTNQKLREALQAISHIDDSTNHAVDASAALDRIGKIARQALALPTADHIPDAGKMIETAAPVGEREALLTALPYLEDMQTCDECKQCYKPAKLSSAIAQAREALALPTVTSTQRNKRCPNP